VQEILQIPFGDFFLDAEKKDLFFNQLGLAKDVESFEARFHSRSGENRWMLISAGMMPENQFVVNIIDITDRKNTELSLLIKDHAISSSINAIAILDLGFNITYVNQSLLSLMDYYHEKDLIGLNTAHLISSPQRFATVMEATNRNASWFGEIALLKNNKKPFYALLWMNKVRDDSGNPICIMASFIDITDRKQMEAVKRRALEQIEKNIEQFAILGDHIRNPLAVIVGLSSLTPGDTTEKILLQAREIDRIITQLDMGWIESDKVRDFIKKYYEVGTPQDAVVDEEFIADESTIRV